MECTCSINADYGGDPVREISDEIKRPAKTHLCDECHREIYRFERYRLETFEYEGRIETHKTCLDCNSVRKLLFCDFSLGTLWEDVWNEIFDNETIPEACISKMTPRAREKVCDLMEKYWKEQEE